MKSSIWILLFISQLSFADEICSQQIPTSRELDMSKFSSKIALITNQISENNETKYESAETYFESIRHTKDFEEKDVKVFLLTLEPICNDKTLAPKFRSKACTTLAGLNGKMAQKLKLNGINFGKKAYINLKQAILIDQNNSEAIIEHAKLVIKLNDQGIITKKLIEAKIGLSVKNETKEAKSNFERLKLTNDPLYKDLKDAL